MHLVKNLKLPLEYSQEVKNLKINEVDVVFDTCLGLGYTALEASKFTSTLLPVKLVRLFLALQNGILGVMGYLRMKK